MYAILSSCQEGELAGNAGVLSLCSWKDAEMLQLTDSGCGQHPPQHITLTGPAAALVARLILNLSPTGTVPTYICEQGHTHRLTIHQREEKMTLSSPGSGMAGGRA